MADKSGHALENTLDDILLKCGTGVVIAGDKDLKFVQCSHGIMRNIDVYQYHIQHDDSIGSKIGHDANISNTAFEIIANANFTQPTDGIQMQVVSDSIEDDVGESGGEILRLTYFTKTTWLKKTTDVELNGTATVNTTATDIYRLEDAEIIDGAPAVGTITIKDTSGTTLYGQIDPLRTFMERCIHYIETGKRCVVTDILVGTQTKEGIIFRLFRTEINNSYQITRGRYSVTLLETTVPLKLTLGIICENPDGDRMAVGLANLGLAASQGSSGSFRYYDEDI